MIPCPYCGNLLLLKPNRSTSDTQLKDHEDNCGHSWWSARCRCGSVFEVQLSTQTRGPDELISKYKLRTQPAETYDAQGNRVAVKR